MPLSFSERFLAFLWRTQDLNPAVMEAANETRTRAIFDLAPGWDARTPAKIRSVGATEIIISSPALFNPDLGDLI
ncbi:MAG: hypothetical protein AB1641_16775 [Thermodesulfobacteriota bacterium]